MKSISIRNKVCVATSISSVSRISEPAISHLPHPNGSYIREHTMVKTVSTLLAALSTPPASISKTPVAAHSYSLPTTSLPIGRTEATVTVLVFGGPQKREAEAIIIDTWLQSTEFESWKNSSKSEVSHSSQYTRVAMPWIGEVEDAKSIDELMTSASKNRKTNARLRES